MQSKKDDTGTQTDTFLKQKLTVFSKENKKLPSNFKLFTPVFVAQMERLEPVLSCDLVAVSGRWVDLVQ